MSLDVEMSGYIDAAKRTESDYSGPVERLQDPRTVRLLHAAMGLCTESAEFLDALKKHIFYGKPLDRVNCREEIGDISWYERIGIDELEASYQEILDTNTLKLRVRYPEKFNGYDAEHRKLGEERQVLEGVNHDWASTAGALLNDMAGTASGPFSARFQNELVLSQALREAYEAGLREARR